MAEERIHCTVCNEVFSKRGYSGHCRSKKHLRALAKQEKKKAPEVKPKEEVPEVKPEEDIDTEMEDLPEATEMQDIPEDKPILEPQTKKEASKKDFLEIRIIDGHDEEKEPSAINEILKTLMTPENLAIAGQIVSQIIMKNVKTPDSPTPLWGLDKSGRPVDF